MNQPEIQLPAFEIPVWRKTREQIDKIKEANEIEVSNHIKNVTTLLKTHFTS
jgi:hypothetical protein